MTWTDTRQESDAEIIDEFPRNADAQVQHIAAVRSEISRDAGEAVEKIDELDEDYAGHGEVYDEYDEDCVEERSRREMI